MSRFLVLTFIVAVTACAPPPSKQSTEIIAMSEAWEDALREGDLDKLVGMYTEDARVMPPNAPLRKGREAVRESFGAMLDAGLSIVLETLESVEGGDVGYNVGVYSISASDGSPADRGKFIEVWRRTNTVWQISNDIWNSDLPAAAAVPADDGLVKVTVTHRVEDPARWLAAWEDRPGSRHELFAEHGAPNVEVLQSPDDAGQVGLVVSVADMDAWQSFLASDVATKAKAEDGVIDETLAVLAPVR